MRYFCHRYTTVLLAGNLRPFLSLFCPFPFLTAKETAAKHYYAIQPASGTNYPQVGLFRAGRARYPGGCANEGRAQQRAAGDRNTTSNASLLYLWFTYNTIVGSSNDGLVAVLDWVPRLSAASERNVVFANDVPIAPRSLSSPLSH